MAFEDKEAELGLLLTRMQNQPQDEHELYELVRQKLNEMKAYRYLPSLQAAERLP
jgi:hypothetical protein